MEVDTNDLLDLLKLLSANENDIKEIIDNAVLQLTKKDILFHLLMSYDVYDENEFNIEINKYKIKNFIVEEFPTYQEYINYFKDWYEKLMDDYYKVMMGKNNITIFLEKEPKDKTYKVEEIIEKLKEFNLYDGCKGFNGK